MKPKIINLNLARDNKHKNTVMKTYELLKERTPMSHTDEWTKKQLQYSHKTMWDFIQCFDLYDEFYDFVTEDCEEMSDTHSFFKQNLMLEYKSREI